MLRNVAMTAVVLAALASQSRADAIHDACARGDLKVVRQLIAASPELLKATREGKTPLHFAARHNRLTVVTFLLSKGADVDAAVEPDLLSKGGATPLLLAAEHADTVLVRVLLDAKANPNVLASVVAMQQPKTPLHCAAGRLDVPMMQALLQAKADVTTLSNGRTALHTLLAAGVKVKTDEGMVRLVDPLLKAAVDVNAKMDDDQFTALHQAASNGWLAVAKKLVDAGADPSITDRNGKSPADYAAAKGDTRLVNYLKSIEKKT